MNELSTTVVALQRFPVKATGAEAVRQVEVTDRGLRGDREWAVYGADGKLASGKHSRRFRRMDPVFDLLARRDGDRTVVVLPDGRELVAGDPGADAALSAHFGEPVRLRRESGVQHQDAATFSLVGTATLEELGRHEGDGRPLDPRHLRANVVVATDRPNTEEDWVGHEVALGPVLVRVTETIERCRMVGVAQVGLAERPGMLRVIGDVNRLQAGIYADVLVPGPLAVGDPVVVR